jgi:hypothetical protein
MGKLSKAQVMTELDAAKISYDENMSYSELVALLPKESVVAPSDKSADAKPVVKAEELPPQVPNGVATANDHEKRIWALERKAGIRDN